MARPPHQVRVPVKSAEVRGFLDGFRSRFHEDLAAVRKLVEEARGNDRRLDSIYKLYSRGDLQNGNELKQARKIRLKFDRHNLKEGVSSASLFDVPDIVGMTIVVPYPSHIRRIAGFVDELIDSSKLANALSRKVLDDAAAAVSSTTRAVISTRHGRPMEKLGYFACHYNVRRGRPGARPICEIQIKTLLHDAWGAKTHDLTYKPAGHTDRVLLRSFELLGDMLANLDHQSDTLRDSIERISSVRAHKRALVQTETLRMAATAGAQSMISHPAASVVMAILEAIERLADRSDRVARGKICDRLLMMLDGANAAGQGQQRRQACLLACYLASRTQSDEDFRWAQEAIESWDEMAESDTERLTAKSFAALAAFGAGDTSEAIELGDEALTFFDALPTPPRQTPPIEHLAHSLFSSMSYYHAERVGSHDGTMSNSAEKSLHFARLAAQARERLGLSRLDQETSDVELRAAMTDPKKQRRAFSAFDND